MTTKLHLAITADFHVIEGFLTAGNVADITQAEALTADVYGCRVAEDMGYDSDAHRDALRVQNNEPVIPGRKNRIVVIEYDKASYRLRSRIERLFGRIKEQRRLAVRYDKSDLAFLAFIALAILKMHLC